MEILDELLVCGFCYSWLEFLKFLLCFYIICGNCVIEKRDSLD